MSQPSSKTPPEPMGVRFYPLRNWCAAKGFTPQHAYNEIKRGRLKIVKSGRRAYVTEDEDRRYTESCGSEAVA